LDSRFSSPGRIYTQTTLGRKEKPNRFYLVILHLAEEAAEEGADTEPLETIPLFPKSDVILESQEGKHAMKGPDPESEGPHLPAEPELNHQLLHLLHVKLLKRRGGRGQRKKERDQSVAERMIPPGSTFSNKIATACLIKK
jgi:hypothetical protein